MLAAAVPSVMVKPLKLITPDVIVKLLLTITLFVVILIAGVAPEVFAIVKLLKTFAVDPDTVCSTPPTNFTPAADAVELSVNDPLLTKFPETFNEASAAAAIVTLEAGNVLLIVKLLHKADVPDAMVGILAILAELEITTSVELVGTELLHQLLAAPQLFVVPNQPPPDKTVTLTAADELVQELAVTCTLYHVVTVNDGVAKVELVAPAILV